MMKDHNVPSDICPVCGYEPFFREVVDTPQGEMELFECQCGEVNFMSPRVDNDSFDEYVGGIF